MILGNFCPENKALLSVTQL